ncbi:MAG: hypothetical protein HRT52_21965 [Colwellia sp.]|nr:hypothetical protein [Colwellia sp.]
MNIIKKFNPLNMMYMGMTALVLSACGGSDSTPTLETPPDNIPTTTVILVQDAEDEDDKGYLIAGNTSSDRESLTLYTFAGDTQGVSTCYDECAQVWLPYTVPTEEHAVTITSGAISVAARIDGSLQVTVVPALGEEPKPLYFYVNDIVQGELLGADIEGWRVSSFNLDKVPDILVASLNFSVDGSITEFFSNGEAECCDQPGAVIDGNGLLGGLFGVGDGFSVTVPAAADGVSKIGFNYYRGADTDGSMTVSIDGVTVGQFVIVPNSADWASLSENAAPTAFLELDTPLAAGDVITVMVDSQFSAGNGESFGFYKPGAATITLATLEVEDGISITEFFSNGEAECCDQAGAVIDDNGLLGGLFGVGDGVAITVPAEAAGANQFGFTYFRGADTDGSMTVSVDDIPVGKLVLVPNSADWASLSENAAPTAFIDLDTPLVAGQIITVMVDSQFSAGNGDAFVFNLTSKPAPVLTDILVLADDGVVTEFFSNGEAECCDQAGAVIDDNGLMGGLFGVGDGFSVTVPADSDGATRFGFSYFRGADTDGSMTVLVDGVAAGTLIIAPNSADWASLSENAAPTAFMNLSTPLVAGQVVTVMVDSQFSAGNGVSVSFYK